VSDLESSSREPGDLEKGGGGLLHLSAREPIAVAPPRWPCRRRRGGLSSSSSSRLLQLMESKRRFLIKQSLFDSFLLCLLISDATEKRKKRSAGDLGSCSLG